MLLLTIDYVPGKELEALGIVKGTVVQSKNFGKDFMAGMKTLVGENSPRVSLLRKNGEGLAAGKVLCYNAQ